MSVVIEWVGAVVAVLTITGAGITLWVKINAQIAVLQDRSDHDAADDAPRQNRDQLVDTLQHQIDDQADEIRELKRELRIEREARQEDNRRSSREIGALREEVLALTRQTKGMS